ncbi:MAG: hypothetical protein ACE37H_12330 [Phycisphaeraceae bacterium]
MSGGLLIAEALYRPPFATVFVALLFALAVILSVRAMRRERALWTGLLRWAGLAGVAWVLLGHSRALPETTGDARPPRLTLLVDTSASMGERDVAVGTGERTPPISRLQAVRDAWLLPNRLGSLRGFAEVEVLAFDEQARPSTPDTTATLSPNGKATRLFDALGSIDADLTLVLSDGHDTTALTAGGFDPSATNAGRIFAVPVGAARSAPDLALQAWPASDRLFEDQATTVTVDVAQRGFEGRSAVVELVHNGEVEARRPVTLNQPAKRLTFEIKPKLGPGRTAEAHHYTARIALAEGEEAYTDNNAEDVFVQVSCGRINVLLVEGEPYWDTRSLARLIGTHPRFDLTAVFAFGDVRRSRIYGEAVEPGTDPTLDLTPFDIVVLGRRVERRVEPAFASELVEFVRRGGAVVFARGQPFGEDTLGRGLRAGIDPISPVDWAGPVIGDLRVRINENAQAQGPLADLRDDEAIARLPGLLAATRIDGRKAASLVILEQQPPEGGPTMAAVTTLRAGSGVTMAVLSEGLWRWELLPGVADDDPAVNSMFGVFWVRALQWLASGGAFLPGQDIALEADRLSVEPGQTVTLNVSTRYIETQGLDLQLTATDTRGISQPITLERASTPGRYTATVSPDETGVYTFALATPGRPDLIDPRQPLTTRLSVVDRSAEQRDTSARPELLKQIAEPTGGRCLALDEDEPVFEALKTLQALRRTEPEVDYDFNTWPVFAWIAGCFGLEWVLRRRSGLR